ncbi:uncharacterized protein LOC105907812 isoform X7 [Clupea harengus]|uniref:Uncharacterized protein LOC105907812 isoform X7 n=1 Tax=Clupea harengus TaxID=7950 RepID=A0A6P8G1F6_CLUHA|nr:uncharacterized protein LOC105907812 isoform X7 [Clupea harengus]
MHIEGGIHCVRWIVFFGFFLPTAGQHHCKGGCGESTIITAFLDSTVILPCSFSNSTGGPVLWSKETDIVNITSLHQVSFLDHKMGRVVVFPNLSQRGNFSIRIEQLQAPDVGVYCCEQGDLCRRVEIKKGERIVKPHEEEKSVVKDLPIGIYIIIAATIILIALVLACFFILKNKWLCVNEVESYYVNHTDNKANTAKASAPSSTQASAPPLPHDKPVQSNTSQEKGRKGDTASNYLRERHPVKRNNLNQGGGDVFTPNQGFSHFNNDIQRGGIMVHRTDSVIYENDEHDPDQQQVGALNTNFQRDISSSPRNHISHVAQPNYANQTEINKERKVNQAGGRDQNYLIQNPIYCNSTEFLNE